MATLSLTNCSREIDEPIKGEGTVVKEGVPFELFALPIETKTAITGFAPRWTESDHVNVFHAIAGSNTYYADGQFDADPEALEAGRFTGTLDADHLPASGNNYDWYLIYPYSQYLTTPVNNTQSPARFYIGKRSDQAQVQTGNSTTNHLSGTNFPLYGVATGVAHDAAPSVTLSNIASVIEVKVTNKNTEPLTVTSVSVTAPSGTSIVGQFEIGFTSSPMTFTNYSTYTSETANLTVNSGTALEKNESATFYLGVKPFTIEADSDHKKDLKIAVNGYEKTISLDKNVSFASGKIKTINFAYDLDPTLYVSGTYVFNTTAGLSALDISAPSSGSGTVLSGNSYTVNGIQAAFAKGSSGTDIRVWNNNGTYELRYYSGNTITITPPSGYNVTEIQTAGSSANNWTSSPTGFSSGKWTGESSSVVLTGNSSGKINTILVKCTKAAVVPTIVDKIVSDIPARGASNLETAITLSNYDSAPTIPTVTPDGEIITSASVKDITATSATLVYTISNNTSGAARAGSVTIADSDNNSGTVTINQVADVFTISNNSPKLSAVSGSTKTFTVTSDFDWEIAEANLTGCTVSPASFTYSSTPSQTVTITATDKGVAEEQVVGMFKIKRIVDNHLSDVITVSQYSAKLSSPSLTITPDAANTKFSVSWAEVTNATKYEYYVLDKDAEYKVAVTQTADASTKSFEVTGINLNEEYTVSVKAIGNSNPWIDSDEAVDEVKVTAGGTNVTFDYSDLYSTVTTGSKNLDGTTDTVSGVSITYTKISGTAPQYYANGTNLRMYNESTLTVTAPSGKSITTIDFSKGTTTWVNEKMVGDVGSVSDVSRKWTCTTETNQVVLTITGSFRFTKIVVTYE